ncbi:histidine phosphatase family protein [Sinisalibacter aestuarii]|uniref:Phosphoglycerate mutase n=1 Tax=Sinisalibacter aestuarii TaxID=2949426 RepID=A0ABQ5LWJ2_9RHOB|nr:histidine phosphatase family protein [Sinisalibacter aestuarii]GKY89355.1 phosphoglycerate mutase [Sinisalibacter aestuarii]
MTRIWWVRHGPTHRREMVGWSDVPADLSDTAALARLGAFLPDAPVISSDLTRAVTTADAIQGRRTRLPHAPGLREINFGAWELLSADEIARRDPALSRLYWDDPVSHCPPGGETLTQLTARVDAALAPLAGHAELIAVAHFGVILSQLHRARGGTIVETLAQRIDNLSVTELRLGPDGWQAGHVNHRP